MDKSAIKNFATSARNKLIEGVIQKAYELGISDKETKQIENLPDGVRLEINNEYKYLTNSEAKNREKLIEQIETKGFNQVIEEVAYTWFNRIIAIRFMEVNDYLPTGVRVLSSEESSKIEPDAVTNAHELIEELELNRDIVFKYQDNNDSEGLFKYILIKQCNALGKIMPVMFEKIEDYTELLLPDNLLVEGSVVRDLVSNITEEDFKEQVEIIGWLYQYYISEKKDEVFADLKKNKKITKENIPAATQLFTPDWIVKYMVENSLGRLWLEGHPNEELQSSWKYYLEEAKQEPEVEKELEKIRDESKSLSPEDITVLDPSMGSGHILVYAFDVLYQIYLSAGYSEREIPRLILEKNIYGLDIDDRAGQLAYFALMMKARSYSRRIFRDMERNPISLNVCSIQESNGLTKEDIEYFANGDETLKKDIEYLVEVFTDAKEYGSILDVKEVNFERIENRLKDIEKDIADLFSRDIINHILNNLPILIKQGKLMSSKYYVCITNPPYIGRKGIDSKLLKYIDSKYKDSKSDTFSVFIEKGFEYIRYNGINSMVTMQTWMFLKAFASLREKLLNSKDIISLIQIGFNSFPELNSQVAHACAFMFRNYKIHNYKSVFMNLNNGKVRADKEQVFLKRKFNKELYVKSIEEIINYVPDSIIAYSISDDFMRLFRVSNKIDTMADLKTGIVAGNNEKYIKYWFEVDNENINYSCKNSEDTINSNKKWYPLNHGGERKKWYGNHYEVINFKNDGEEISREKNSMLRNKPYYFRKGINWNRVGSTVNFAARVSLDGFIFDDVSPSAFVDNENAYKYLIAYMNTKLFNDLLNIITTGLKTEVGHIAKLPIINIKDNKIKSQIINLADTNIYLAKQSWDKFEFSWDFKKNILLNYNGSKIISAVEDAIQHDKYLFTETKNREQNLNDIFTNIFDVSSKYIVEDRDVTIEIRNREKVLKEFISYAVGCMMGRYSLDEEGLVFAGGEFDINKYNTFKADEDAIIPITDAEYFEDDIVSKFVEFVKVVFGEDSLEENLNYIADTECFKRKTNESSRDCLRRYFLKGFMEDHLKVYQKRPIYWMFDSGKQNGFKALIYMHRYNESMVAKIRTDYLHTLQRKYESEIDRLDNDMNSEVVSAKEKASAKKRKEALQKQLVECVAYDQVIAHVANQRIEIDLDDGVKVNYQKFQGVEVPQGDGKKDLKADLLFKVKM